MPRAYSRKPDSRKYGYSAVDLQSAIDDVKQGRLSISKSAKKYNISKGTLVNKIKGKHSKEIGRPLVFSEAEENVFVEHIIVVSTWGFPFDAFDLRILAKKYLDKSGRTVEQFEDNMPSSEWAWRFLKRYKNTLSSRMCQNIKKSKAGVTINEIEKYFKNLNETLKDGENATVPPKRIFNYDETNLSDDPGVKKCIFKKGVKYAERIKETSKASTSVMYVGSAAGELLPPYVVYKSSHLWETWMNGGPPGTRYNRSLSGWFDTTVFADWFEHLFIPKTRRLGGKIVLIGDNLSSHFSPRVLKLAQNNNIAFVCIPPNSTHIAQPLDVAFYAPLKKFWRKILDNWKCGQKKYSQTLSKESFPHLLNQLQEKLTCENISQNLISGFRKCGIFPFDPNQIINRLPRKPPSEETQEISIISNIVSDSVIELLNKSRNEENENPTRKRKLIKIPPGTGITLEELEKINEQNKTVKLNAETNKSKKRDKPNKINSARKKVKKNKLVASACKPSCSTILIDEPNPSDQELEHWTASDEELFVGVNLRE